MAKKKTTAKKKNALKTKTTVRKKADRSQTKTTMDDQFVEGKSHPATKHEWDAE